MAALVAEIEQLLKKTEDIWDSQQYGRLKDLWDPDEEMPFYLAEEGEDWVFGWPALERYWEPIPGQRRIEAIRMRFSKVEAKLIAPDLAVAAYWVHHDIKMKGPLKPWGGDARVMSIFRKKQDGWRYVCYCEAPQSPLLYMQGLYEKNMSDEFPDFRRQVHEREQMTAAQEG